VPAPQEPWLIAPASSGCPSCQRGPDWPGSRGGWLSKLFGLLFG
jgi:hypothetical protein